MSMLRRAPTSVVARLSQRRVFSQSAIVRTTAPPNQPLTPKSRPRGLVRAALVTGKYAGLLVASTALGVFVVGGVIFIHDAFTYSTKHLDRVPVSPLALHPEAGGPKSLPIAKTLIGDDDNEETAKLAKKPHIVVVGGGWGAIGFLQSLNPGDYHITLVSPETFTTFTPLLPSAAVGTVSPRSLVESLRKVIARVRGHYIPGAAVDVAFNEQLLEVKVPGPEPGTWRHVYIPYDKLIIACGSVSSTHGVPGLENSFSLKTISDSQAIRRRVLDNFEIASLPTTSPEERRRLLSFVVAGGGPTGVEAAAEIYDLCQEDMLHYYPRLCREEASIHIIQSREHILNTYSEAISEYAENKFRRDNVNLIVNARVKEICPDKVVYTTRKKLESGKSVQEVHEIPTNFVLWSTGIAMNPFTERVASLLPNQFHKKAIEVDAHLRVRGAPAGTVYALGDASTIETDLVPHLLDLVEAADKNKDGKIDFNEWQIMVAQIKTEIPMATQHLEKVRDLFEQYDTDADDSLTLNELASLLQDIGRKITPLPQTAQVASQQGHYLGRKFSKIARAQRSSPNGSQLGDHQVSPAFEYRHLGSLAYIGNAAVFDFGGVSFMGGLAAMYAWRSIYWSEQVSMRTRALLMFDWVIRGIWGRDLSRL